GRTFGRASKLARNSHPLFGRLLKMVFERRRKGVRRSRGKRLGFLVRSSRSPPPRPDLSCGASDLMENAGDLRAFSQPDPTAPAGGRVFLLSGRRSRGGSEMGASSRSGHLEPV